MKQEDIYKNETLEQLKKIQNLPTEIKAKIYLDYLILKLKMKYDIIYRDNRLDFYPSPINKYPALGINSYIIFKEITYQSFDEFIDLTYSIQDLGIDYKEKGWGIRYWFKVNGQLFNWYKNNKQAYIAQN